MTVQIPVRIPQEDADRLDKAVADGRYESRSDAVRAGIEVILKRIRDDEIAEEYRRAYTEHPQEEWIGEAGLILLAELVQAEEEGQEPL